MLNRDRAIPGGWVAVPLLALAFTALPQGVIKIFEIMDGGDAVGADIGGGLIALASPLALAFLLGLLFPSPWRFWGAASALSLLLTTLMYLLLLDLGWEEVLVMLPFDAIMAVIFTVAGVVGSKIRREGLAAREL